MRSFLEYVALCENYVEFHDYNLESKFSHYNQLLFGGKIPHCPLSWDPALKGAAGLTTYDHQGPKYISGTLNIRISTRFRRTERMIDQTLIHEMIHAYLAVTGRPDVNHGFMFKSWAAHCEQKVGFPIPLTDRINDLELVDEDGALVSVLMRKYATKNSGWFAAFFPPPTFDSTERIHELMSYYGVPGKMDDGEELLVIKIHTNLGRKFGMSRLTTLRNIQFSKLNEKDTETLLQKGQIVRRIEPGTVTHEFAAQNQQRKDALVVMKTNTRTNETTATFYVPQLAAKPSDLSVITGKAETYAGAGYDVSIFTTKTGIFNRGYKAIRDSSRMPYYLLKPHDVEELKQNASYIRQWSA